MEKAATQDQASMERVATQEAVDLIAETLEQVERQTSDVEPPSDTDERPLEHPRTGQR